MKLASGLKSCRLLALSRETFGIFHDHGQVYNLGRVVVGVSPNPLNQSPPRISQPKHWCRVMFQKKWFGRRAFRLQKSQLFIVVPKS